MFRRTGTRHAVTTAVALAMSMTFAAPTHADRPEFALNGIYQAVSNGDWAKTDDVYHDEATVVSVWTISSTCSDPQTCSGHVVSDQGWSADVTFRTQSWSLRRTLDEWQPCPDGTTSPGYQHFRFWPMVGNTFNPGSPVLGGEDLTTGEPGACGVGYPLQISLPFRLTKVA